MSEQDIIKNLKESKTSLKMEGMIVTKTEEHNSRLYLTGQISKKELINRALKNAGIHKV